MENKYKENDEKMQEIMNEMSDDENAFLYIRSNKASIHEIEGFVGIHGDINLIAMAMADFMQKNKDHAAIVLMALSLYTEHDKNALEVIKNMFKDTPQIAKFFPN